MTAKLSIADEAMNTRRRLGLRSESALPMYHDVSVAAHKSTVEQACKTMSGIVDDAITWGADESAFQKEDRHR